MNFKHADRAGGFSEKKHVVKKAEGPVSAVELHDKETRRVIAIMLTYRKRAKSIGAGC